MKTAVSEIRHKGNYSKPAREMARGTVQIMISHLFRLLCGYVIVVLLARGLGPEEYGIYGVIMSVLLWLEFSSRLGIPQTMAKLIPENDQDAPKLERTAIGLSLGICLAVFIIFIIVAPALAHLFNMPHSVNLFRLAVIDIPFYSMYCVGAEILGGRRHFGAASIRMVIYGIAKAAGIIILYFGGLSVAGALIVNIVASIVALAFMFTQISFRKLFPVPGYIGPILKLAFPMGLYTIGWNGISSLGIWCLKVVGSNLPEGAPGLYIAAINIAKIPGIAAFVMTAVLIPFISRSLAQKDYALSQKYVQDAMRFLFIVLLPVCILIALTSEEAMGFVYSASYTSGGIYLVLLVFGFGFMLNFLATFCAILIANGEPYLAAGTALGLIPFGLLLNLVLIPKYGAMGAAQAELLTFMTGAFFTGYLVYKRFGTLIQLIPLIKTLIATTFVALGAIIIGAESFWTIPKYLFLLGGYAGILMILKEIKREDLEPFVLWQKE